MKFFLWKQRMYGQNVVRANVPGQNVVRANVRRAVSLILKYD
jgi:hypothetical protein